MNLSAVAKYRLLNQNITKSGFTKAKELVSHMGAMQAQDFAMSKWAIGLRVPGLTEKEINASIDKGEIIRTHVLRPTWHLVNAQDVHWMLALTGPKIRSSLNGRHKELELDENIISKAIFYSKNI